MHQRIFTPLVMLAFCLGICLAVMPSGFAAAIPLSSSALFTSLFIFLFTSLGVLLLVIVIARREHDLPYLCLAVFILGILCGLYSAQKTVSHLLPAEFDDQTFTVVGNVTGLPRAINHFNRQGQQFDLEVNQWHCQIKTDQCKNFDLSFLRLRWYGEKIVHAGEQWQLTVQLRRPRGLASPAARDYDVWLIAQGFSTTGKVLEGRRLSVANGLFAWRESLSELIREELQGFSQAGILEALINGNSAAISTTQWQLFADTNTTHLFVISGLHLSLMGGCCWWMLRRLLVVILPFSPWFAASLAALSAWFLTASYAFIAGWTIPVQRSLAVFTLVLLLLLIRRAVQPLQVFLLLLAVCLAADPLSIYSLSFWLSWSAAAVLVVSLTGRKNSSFFALWWRSQWAITLGLAPLLIIATGQVSLLGFFANALAIPLVNLLVVPLDLLALALYPLSADVAHGLWLGLNFLLQHLLDFLQWMVNVGGIFIFNPVTAIVPIVFLACAAIIFLLPATFPCRSLFLLGFLPIVFWPEPVVPDDQLDMTVFDVGQGLAVMIQVADHVLLFDTGPRMGDTLDAGKAIVLPYLYRQGIRHIDYLVVSHADMDHAGGVASITKKITPKKILIGETISALEGEKCRQDKSWRWQQFQFEFINPESQGIDNGFFTKAGNNRSCVLRISRLDKPQQPALLLLTGDIERPVEYYLLRHHLSGLRSDVLLMPHHGSRTSSSSAFVKAVNPQWAIASSGYRHRFGHPHQDIVQRYRNQGADVLNTADTGTITMHWRDGQWQIDALYRPQQGYFW